MGFTRGLVDELDAVGDWGLLTTDADLVVTGWNRWLERHAGRPASAIVGRRLFDVFPELPTRKLDRYYQQALGGQIVVLSQRLHKYVLPLPPPPAGKAFDHMQQSVRIVPLTDGGAACGTVTVVEDVTERVAYETELRQRVEALREADRRKDEFLAMLAHELRNPLAPVRNGLQILKLSRDPETLGRVREMIERQVSHLVRLVDDLLDVSRLVRGKVTLRREPLDLAEVIARAVETAQPAIDAAEHELIVTASGDPLRVDGDAVRLTQVVSNLLVNAAKYSEPGGRITVTAATEGNAAIIRVRDTGVGIAPEQLGVVFELFAQVDRSTARSQGGLGIGLTLVRRLVEMHGGTVEARSEGVGRGSEFVVRLPLLKPTAGATAGVPQVDAPRAGRPRRVVVVDDNVDAAESLAALLRIAGHEVQTAYDGPAGLSATEALRPDVVMLDIGLPGMTGYEVASRLRERPESRETVLVALTGYGQEEDRHRGRAAGFDHHFVKPVEPAAVVKFLADIPAAVDR